MVPKCKIEGKNTDLEQCLFTFARFFSPTTLKWSPQSLLTYLHSKGQLHSTLLSIRSYYTLSFCTLKSWLISNPFIQTHLRIRIGHIILCTIHSESNLTDRGGNRPKCDLFVTGLAFTIVKATGQHSIFWNKSVIKDKLRYKFFSSVC